MYNINCEAHQYYLSSTKTNLRDGYFTTRREAEIKMHNYCDTRNLKVECIENSKHSKLYLASDGSEFCINRI